MVSKSKYIWQFLCKLIGHIHTNRVIIALKCSLSLGLSVLFGFYVVNKEDIGLELQSLSAWAVPENQPSSLQTLELEALWQDPYMQ